MTRISATSLNYPGDGLYYYKGNPFTGTAYDLNDDGELESETEYRNGLQWGMTREWFEPKRLAYEGKYFKGVLHGVEREWHDNGQLAKEGEYEYGITIWEKSWDEDGNLDEEYELSKDDEDYQTLLEYRKLYKDAAAQS